MEGGKFGISKTVLSWHKGYPTLIVEVGATILCKAERSHGDMGYA